MMEPFKILKNDTYGRYMVANRLIKQGELILKEKPAIVGTHVNGRPICFRCCQILYKTSSVCKNCKKAPLCSTNCKGQFHTNDECNELAQWPITPLNLISNPQVITTLRCLLLREYNPQKWAQLLQLESHLLARKDTPIWFSNRANVEDILGGFNCLSEDDAKGETVQKICGILDVNCFEMRPPQSGFGLNPEVDCLRGLFLKASLMTHNCLGNVHLSVDDDFVLYIHASREILEGETIFFNYSDSLKGTQERREHLREGKYFECICERCLDNSELGTNMSSLKCPRCKTGLLKFNNAAWFCDDCSCEFRNNLVKTTLLEAQEQIRRIDISNHQDVEKLLKKLLCTFHFNHFVIIDLKQTLVGLYSQLPLSIKNLLRKIELCEDLMKIFLTVEPGISRAQGITLYELYSAKVILCQKQLKQGDITKATFTKTLTESESILKEALKHLLYEPIKSPEGRLSQNSLKELKQLRKLIVSSQAELTP